MEKRTVLDLIEARQADLGVRLRRAIVDGETVISGEYHRISIPAGADVDVFLDEVDRSLEAMDWPPIQSPDRAKIEAVMGAAFPDGGYV